MITDYSNYFGGGSSVGEDDDMEGMDDVDGNVNYSGDGEPPTMGMGPVGDFMVGWVKLSMIPLLIFAVFLFLVAVFMYMISFHKFGMFLGVSSIFLGVGVSYVIIKG